MNMPLFHLGLQAEPQSLSHEILDEALQAKIAQIETNNQSIIAINAAKGAADGFAPLNANQKLPTSYLEASALAEWKGNVADEAGMTSVSNAGPTDWVFREDSGTIFFFTYGDSSDAANWREMAAPNTGVISVDGETGAITLAAVAKSGSSTDVSYDSAGKHYITTANVSDGLGEVDAQLKVNADAASNNATAIQNETTARNTAIQNEQTARGTAISTAVSALEDADDELQNQIDASVAVAAYKVGVVCTGAIDGTNDQFSVPEAYVDESIELNWRGQTWHAGHGFTINPDKTLSLDIVPPAGSPAPRANYLKSGN